jgi:HEAT repeat protein
MGFGMSIIKRFGRLFKRGKSDNAPRNDLTPKPSSEAPSADGETSNEKVSHRMSEASRQVQETVRDEQVLTATDSVSRRTHQEMLKEMVTVKRTDSRSGRSVQGPETRTVATLFDDNPPARALQKTLTEAAATLTDERAGGTNPSCTPHEILKEMAAKIVGTPAGKRLQETLTATATTLTDDLVRGRCTPHEILEEMAAKVVGNQAGGSRKKSITSTTATVADERLGLLPRATITQPPRRLRTLAIAPFGQIRAASKKAPPTMAAPSSTLVNPTQIEHIKMMSPIVRHLPRADHERAGVGQITMITLIDPPLATPEVLTLPGESTVLFDAPLSNVAAVSEKVVEKQAVRDPVNSTPAVRAFAESLVADHLSEIVSLFSQCTQPTLDRTYRWGDVDVLESRLKSHMRALSLVKDGIMPTLLEELENSDSDNLAGVTYVLITIFGDQALPRVLERFESTEETPIVSMTTAMKHASCPQLSECLLPLLKHECPALRTATAEIAAFRGELLSDELSALMGQQFDSGLAAILSDELSKLPLEMRVSVWQKMLDSEEEAAQRSAVFSMLKAHQEDGIVQLFALFREADEIAPWMLDCLALSGGEYTFEQLARYMKSDRLCVNAVRGMGRLGNTAAVDILLDLLESDCEDVRMATGEALDRITGAHLIEQGDSGAVQENDEVGVDDDDDDDELSDPAVSLSKSEWDTWWSSHRNDFQTGRCYRNGALFGFDQCIEEIANEDTPNSDRIDAHLELIIRANVDIPLKIEWSVEKQRQAIDALWGWWRDHEEHFPKGGWYFGAERIW